MVIKNITKIKIKELISILYLIETIIGSLAIFHSDTTLASKSVQSIVAGILLLSTICSIVLCALYFRKLMKLSILCLIPLFYYAIYYSSPVTEIAISIYGILRFSMFFLLKSEIQERIFVLYKKFIVITAVIGLICYVSYILHLPIPYRTVDYYTVNAQGYIDYLISYLCIDNGQVQLCGLFNEPGYFGTILALVLCSEKLDFKKKSNIIMLISGFLTFSLAFIMIIAIYFIGISYKKPKVLFLTVVGVIIYIFVIPNIHSENVLIQEMLERIRIVDGKLVGNNRTSLSFDLLLAGVMASSNRWFGMGSGYAATQVGGILSIKTYLVNNGIIGTLVMFGTPLIIALKRSFGNYYSILFVICFALSTIQRPHIFNLPYMVILVGGIISIRRTQYETKN